MEDILVSIHCITYNHEKYIADAIDSFLMQKTNFKYEILIHDDASTDKTADIIREYEKKYPELIKPIYQSENQYSKGIAVEEFNRKRAKGKYIAVCEGDDYWTDLFKLQKQIDYLEKNPECSLVFHAAEFVNISNEPTGTIAKIAEENRIVYMDEISSKATPYYIPTASRVYRKSSMEDLPSWYFKASIGDFPSALLIGNKGYFYYINEIMSAYRTGVPGSWTQRTFNGINDIKKNIELNKEIIQILNDFNEYSNYKFKKELYNAKKERIITIIVFKMSTYFPKWLVNYFRNKVDITWIIKKTKRII
ncbi:glycosyltransferase family 2 protein [Rummeliibacillus pycnus]|uniref:glycosyltransferase family 2 protein n=1 Tax=Rummeliibacillus pycnus TaxID=101070 RepID=UPI0037CA3635